MTYYVLYNTITWRNAPIQYNGMLLNA